MALSLKVLNIKGHCCHNNAHMLSGMTPFFSTTRLPVIEIIILSCKWVSLEFHMTFENLFICRLLTFCFEKIFVMCMSFEGSVNRIQAHTLHKFVLHVFSLLVFFFSFLFQNKTAFISRQFKNPLLRTSDFFNGVQLKTQNVPFRSLIDRVVFSQKYLYQL